MIEQQKAVSVEELAEEFDEDVELIKETVKYLLDNNMISIESVDLESE